MSTLRIPSLIVFVLVMIACSRDATTPDAPAAVDARPADSVVQGDAPGPDALAFTPCGDNLSCNATKEICVVRTPVGPGQTHTCEKIPDACVADHSCACAGGTLCTDAFNTCSDPGDANTIVCECQVCQ